MTTRQAKAQREEAARVREAIDELPPPRPDMLDRDIFTVEDLAVVLRVTAPTVREWINRGDLRAFKFGNRGGFRIRREAVQDFLVRLEAETMAAIQAGRRE